MIGIFYTNYILSLIRRLDHSHYFNILFRLKTSLIWSRTKLAYLETMPTWLHNLYFEVPNQKYGVLNLEFEVLQPHRLGYKVSRLAHKRQSHS